VFNSIVFAIFAILWARAFFGRLPGAPRGGVVGVVGGAAGWLLTGLMPAAVGLGVLGALLGLLGGGGGGGAAGRGGWGVFPGGFGGGGIGGGGFGGGGGFSGGGGSFGGGGASGSW
ncbi:MAG: YgcG family protein, partial [Rudaea sp.]